ncbi:hypothetical protein [Gilliamella sp. App6-5]|uniref:hypothetical protein n=1 Tax=Gilliamella sp. App6-5 TaxID=3120232 RepID=UPI001C3FF79C|nr:hypothetical protein [Gilliamella apicola]
MQRSTVNVKIYWRSIQQGGKLTLPINTKYYPITEPLKDKQGDMTSWSLVINVKNNENINTHERIGFGEARFLMENAPSYLLNKGFKIIIYEGPKQVATVEVL